MMNGYVYDDGGREAAGFKGKAGDCVVRAIAIATEKPYKEVYDELSVLVKAMKITKETPKKRVSARNGVYRKVFQKYLNEFGWKWKPTMFVGQGCTVHLSADELPKGRLIVRLSSHLTAMIDGVIHDTYDPRRKKDNVESRCVYGYFYKPTRPMSR